MLSFYSLVLEYIVEVHTGSEAGADSEVNVHAHIVGTRGDTGVRKLLKSVDTNEDLFTAGKASITLDNSYAMDNWVFMLKMPIPL